MAELGEGLRSQELMWVEHRQDAECVSKVTVRLVPNVFRGLRPYKGQHG